MYIKNRRNSGKTKGFGSFQSLCLTVSEVHRNRLLFIYVTCGALKEIPNEFKDI